MGKMWRRGRGTVRPLINPVGWPLSPGLPGLGMGIWCYGPKKNQDIFSFLLILSFIPVSKEEHYVEDDQSRGLRGEGGRGRMRAPPPSGSQETSLLHVRPLGAPKGETGRMAWTQSFSVSLILLITCFLDGLGQSQELEGRKGSASSAPAPGSKWLKWRLMAPDWAGEGLAPLLGW